REAEIAAAFAETLTAPIGSAPPRAKDVRIYYSDDEDDLYSGNLRDVARNSFSGRGFTVESVAFGAGGAHLRNGDRHVANAASAGRDTCSYGGLAFFAARGSDFDEFASSAASCGSKATFIGDDDVSAHVADETARHHVRAIPYYFLSFANAPIDKPAGVASDFYETLRNLFSFEQ
ncbi:hypothetical protein ACW9HQ_51925, partial [Nocardia gipuzkoensis]